MLDYTRREFTKLGLLFHLLWCSVGVSTGKHTSAGGNQLAVSETSLILLGTGTCCFSVCIGSAVCGRHLLKTTFTTKPEIHADKLASLV